VASRFLTGKPLPFCGGCGHALVTQNTARALEKTGLAPLDVVLVTDIGCHGIIDRNFLTHTVHGLHGRSVALGSGIAAGLGRGKVLVYLGDGGAVIGLSHLVDAASRNFDLTVIVHNNMLYGMTGGQPSGLTPCGFKTPTHPEGKAERGYDLCRIIHAAGATRVQRLMASGDFSDAVAQALSVKGFALVEAMELCPSYGVKHNPRKVSEIAEEAGLGPLVLENPARPVYRPLLRPGLESLLPASGVPASHSSTLKQPVAILIAGSAGEGVQQAAETLCRAAMASGLEVTKKGTYPVTVGTGYSVAEMVLSPRPILFTGAPVPDALVITSSDGLGYAAATAGRMTKGKLLIDSTLEPPKTGATIMKADLRKKAGARDAALYALALLVRELDLFPLARLAAAALPRVDLARIMN